MWVSRKLVPGKPRDSLHMAEFVLRRPPTPFGITVLGVVLGLTPKQGHWRQRHGPMARQGREEEGMIGNLVCINIESLLDPRRRT